MVEIKLFRAFKTLLELIYTSACIDELLLAGEEGMTLGANFNLHVTFGRTGYNSLAACALDCNFLVFGMESFFHDIHLFNIICMDFAMPKISYTIV